MTIRHYRQALTKSCNLCTIFKPAEDCRNRFPSTKTFERFDFHRRENLLRLEQARESSANGLPAHYLRGHSDRMVLRLPRRRDDDFRALINKK